MRLFHVYRITIDQQHCHEGTFSTLEKAFGSVRQLSLDLIPTVYTITEDELDQERPHTIKRRWYVALGQIVETGG